MTAAEIKQNGVPEEALTFAAGTGGGIELSRFVPATELAESIPWEEYGVYGRDYWIVCSLEEKGLFALASIPLV